MVWQKVFSVALFLVVKSFAMADEDAHLVELKKKIKDAFQVTLKQDSPKYFLAV
jgi:hypothetical protein